MDFRASSLPYRFHDLKGPWKFTGLEDAGSDRFAISITRPPSQPLAGIPILFFCQAALDGAPADPVAHPHHFEIPIPFEDSPRLLHRIYLSG
jgi:hypothetical protein